MAPPTAGIVESLLARLPETDPLVPPVTALSWTLAAATRREISPSATKLAAATAAEPPSFGDIIQYTMFHRSPSASPIQNPHPSVTGIVTGDINASSPDGGLLSYKIAQGPVEGSVEIGPDGTYTYTHGGGLSPAGGTDSFSVTIDDGSAYRLEGFGGAIQGIFMAVAQILGLRQPDTITVSVPVSLVINVAPVAGAPVVGLPDRASGLVTGQVTATDADGDLLIYSAAATTATGSAVSINPLTGVFTYSPSLAARNAAAADSATTETFIVTAVDGYGGSIGVPVTVTVLPSASVRFNLVYGAGSEYFSDAFRNAIQTAADYVASYLVVSTPVTLTYDITGYSDTNGVAAAASPYFAWESSGLVMTVVQKKIITAIDANGDGADAGIAWNFGRYSWTTQQVGADYDVASVAIHEFLHILGFTSIYLDDPGSDSWTVYDSLLITPDGTAIIPWSDSYAANLSGGNGGLFLGGPNAVAAYGGPVPVDLHFWHLDDGQETVMNGPHFDRVWVISAVELGILRDLGYTVVSQPPLYAVV